MGERTGIQWCDSTATPVIGCWPVSPGCANCWARNDTPARVLRAGKWPGHREPFETWTKDGPRYRVKGFADTLRRMNARPWICDGCGAAKAGRTPLADFQPCACGSVEFHRRRVFIGDSCDLFDPAWPADWLAETLWQMSLAPDVVQILCTKRPELFDERMLAALNSSGGKWGTKACDFIHGWKCGAQVPQNVCVLASVESQEQEARVKGLLRIPARWHGLSCEPLLGPLDPTRVYWPDRDGGAKYEDALRDPISDYAKRHYPAARSLNVPRLSWLIIGGESGLNARPCNVGWIRALVRQGQTAGVATFVKQLGANVVTDDSLNNWPSATRVIGKLGSEDSRVLLEHHKGGDPSEWPDDLRIQQWPEGM